MLDLFLQVPELVRTRLAKRCRDVYEHVRKSQSTSITDDDDDEDNQVLHSLTLEILGTRCTGHRSPALFVMLSMSLSPPLSLIHTHSHTLPPLQQYVAALDLSGVDLSQPSSQRLRRNHTWTLLLACKLSAPLLAAVVRLLSAA
jgi:hypothetical protein